MSLIPFSQRNRDFSTIYNFRDFGGYAGHEGRAVKTDRLFRSAHLAALSPEDRDAIGALNIDLVVDLRYAPERKKQPSRFPDPMPHVHEYPDAPEERGAKVAPHEAFLEHDLQVAQDAHDYMMKSYTGRPHDPGFQRIFADTLTFMAKADDTNPARVLVHCAAGKDRTGTLCALVQSVLGVSREDIMADFMMTLEAVDIDKIIGPAAQRFTTRYGRKIDPEALWPMFGVFPEYLSAALDGMLDSSGDITAYVTETLKVSPEDIATLRSRYLED